VKSKHAKLRIASPCVFLTGHPTHVGSHLSSYGESVLWCTYSTEAVKANQGRMVRQAEKSTKRIWNQCQLKVTEFSDAMSMSENNFLLHRPIDARSLLRFKTYANTISTPNCWKVTRVLLGNGTSEVTAVSSRCIPHAGGWLLVSYTDNPINNSHGQM
jgi:hypothetical protein